MTVGGFLVLPGFYSHRYDFAAYPLFGESDLSLHLAVAFLAYLFLDLSLGMLFYRSQMTILNGYFHHTIYSLMTLFAIHRRLPMVYLLYWPEELPMVLMSIGALNPAARVNMRFGLSYFVTRICWHIYLTASLWSHEMILGVLSLAVFPLNAYFFYGWVKQQLRKRGENRKKAKLEDDVESDAENETKTPGLRRRRTANTPVSSTESSEEKNNILESRSRFAKLRERLNAAWRRMRRKGRPQKMC